MPSPLDPTRDPARLGPYTLLERAGAGGMGVVYRARHDATGAIHAVKALSPGAGVDDLLRFRREAEAMAAVEGHPHVLRVHSVGVDGGRPFLAMAWAPGGSLADRLRAGPLPVDGVVALGRALASGLAHLHTRGVLHRDLKPENVLHDEQGAPRLADFGLARLQQAETLTATGDVLGTPAYMAPEQAEGRRDLDARTDVYGLGAVLYRALTGRPPHAGATSMAALLAALAAAPPPPRALRPDVPPWLEAVVLKALAPVPDQRWPSAEALGAALAAGPAGAGRGARALVALALAALALVALAGVTARRAPRAPEPAAVTPAPLDLEAALARGDHAAAADLVRAAMASDAPEGARAAVLALVDAGDADGAERLLAPALAEARSARAALLLGVEVALARDDAATAAARAAAAHAARPDAATRWALGRALLLTGGAPEAAGALLDPEVGRLSGGVARRLHDLALHREALAGLAAEVGQRAGSLGVSRFHEAPDAPAQLAERVRGVAAAAPAPTLAPLRRAGEAWASALARDLLVLDGELVRLSELTPPLTSGELASALDAVAAAAGVQPEVHALRALGLVARCHEARHRARESKTWPVPFDPELLRAIDAALEGPLPGRYRRAAEATRYLTLTDERARADEELARAEAGLAELLPYADPLRGLLLAARERVAQQLGHRAWGDPAGRRRWAARMIAACEDPWANSSDPALPRHRTRALLLAGEPPRAADLALSKPGEQALFAAERALALGELDVAAAAYRELVARATERIEKDRVLVDALCGLAVAVAAEGDLTAARAHLAEARRAHAAGDSATLPWRTPGPTAAALDLIAEGAWSPGRGEAFPPALPP